MSPGKVGFRTLTRGTLAWPVRSSVSPYLVRPPHQRDRAQSHTYPHARTRTHTPRNHGHLHVPCPLPTSDRAQSHTIRTHAHPAQPCASPYPMSPLRKLHPHLRTQPHARNHTHQYKHTPRTSQRISCPPYLQHHTCADPPTHTCAYPHAPSHAMQGSATLTVHGCGHPITRMRALAAHITPVSTYPPATSPHMQLRPYPPMHPHAHAFPRNAGLHHPHGARRRAPDEHDARSRCTHYLCVSFLSRPTPHICTGAPIPPCTHTHTLPRTVQGFTTLTVHGSLPTLPLCLFITRPTPHICANAPIHPHAHTHLPAQCRGPPHSRSTAPRAQSPRSTSTRRS